MMHWIITRDRWQHELSFMHSFNRSSFVHLSTVGVAFTSVFLFMLSGRGIRRVSASISLCVSQYCPHYQDSCTSLHFLASTCFVLKPFWGALASRSLTLSCLQHARNLTNYLRGRSTSNVHIYLCRQQVSSKVELYIVLPCPQDMFCEQCIAPVEVCRADDGSDNRVHVTGKDRWMNIRCSRVGLIIVCWLILCDRMGTGSSPSTMSWTGLVLMYLLTSHFFFAHNWCFAAYRQPT